MVFITLLLVSNKGDGYNNNIAQDKKFVKGEKKHTHKGTDMKKSHKARTTSIYLFGVEK